MGSRTVVMVLILLGFARAATAQECSDSRAALYRHAVIVCDHGTLLTKDKALPATCAVVQTLPACPPGLAAPIPSDVAGVWHDGGGLTFVIRIDDDGIVTGSARSNVHPGVTRITAGDFEPTSRTLDLTYVTVAGPKASAILNLSGDDNTLSGEWSWAGGSHGTWTMTRVVATTGGARFAAYADCISYGEGSGREAQATPAVLVGLVLAPQSAPAQGGPPAAQSNPARTQIQLLRLERPICRITPNGPEALTLQAPQAAPPR